MAIDANQIVSVVEIVVYVPALLLSLIVCNRHGFSRSSGWYYTFTLSLIRIIGDVLLLLTYSNTSTGLLIAAVIFDHIGLTPLLLATLGMLSRFTTTSITIKYFRLVQLAVVVGAVLGIVGAEQASSSSSPSAMTYIAVLCYVAAYAVIVLVFCLALPFTREHIRDAERALAPAIGLALPLVLVRLAYQVLVVFVHRGAFSRLGQGSVGVHVAMAVVEEFVVVAIYLFLGFRLDRLNVDEQGPILSRTWKDRGSRGERRSRSRKRGRSGRGVADERRDYWGEEDGRNYREMHLQSVGIEQRQAYN
uniref:DUF7702 domain-containing protein n=1 Tax=Talaromyces marneffei PM1 TaxID=1077442 RepID=A0A093Y042_TALMA